MNQAMMELYKTEKINPLGGCFPILVQIPVFIALYWVLLARDRAAPRAVHAVDQGPLGARSVLRAADPDDRHDGAADQAEPGAARPGAGAGDAVHAVSCSASSSSSSPPAWCSTGWSTTSFRSPSSGRSSACSSATSLPMPSAELAPRHHRRDRHARRARRHRRGARLRSARSPRSPRRCSARCPRRGIATLRAFRDARGERIDEGIALYFPAPHSYTGEAGARAAGPRRPGRDAGAARRLPRRRRAPRRAGRVHAARLPRTASSTSRRPRRSPT